MYVDESGDTGLLNSPTRYFILTGIVFHELRWTDVLSDLVSFRKMLRDTRGLKLREEIHAKDFVNSPGALMRIRRNDRVDILKKCIEWLNSQSDVSVFSIVVDKQGKTGDIFDLAWNALLMRFENTIRYKNFPGPQNADDRGIVLSDNTDGKKLTKLIRKMRHYNTIPNTGKFYTGGYRNMKLQYLIEDPILRDSSESLMHQIADVAAYIIRQKYEPNAYMKKKAGHTLYKKLEDVALKVATNSNNFGLVEL
ncbi:MAG TPA: DUF3800 domain-containing protein [Flavobacterium sp.]|jgi:hypothetical protein